MRRARCAIRITALGADEGVMMTSGALTRMCAERLRTRCVMGQDEDGDGQIDEAVNDPPLAQAEGVCGSARPRASCV